MKHKSFLDKYEFLIPLFLFVGFLFLTLPGISWGAPEVWHPDEIVVRSMKALFEPDYRFDEVNFDYPTLPQHAMYGLGKIVLALGYSETEILVSARVLSALLAGLTVLLTYAIARRAGGSVTVAGLSGLVLICVSEMVHNGRFAHNDTFLIFFTTLAVLCVIEYFNRRNKLWLYGSFLAVGLAASCKYIGGSLILLPLGVYGLGQWKNLRRDSLPVLETLFIGGTLMFLGFAAGTPKALFWMAYWVKRLLPAHNLIATERGARVSNYWIYPNTLRDGCARRALVHDAGLRGTLRRGGDLFRRALPGRRPAGRRLPADTQRRDPEQGQRALAGRTRGRVRPVHLRGCISRSADRIHHGPGRPGRAVRSRRRPGRATDLAGDARDRAAAGLSYRFAGDVSSIRFVIGAPF